MYCRVWNLRWGAQSTERPTQRRETEDGQADTHGRYNDKKSYIIHKIIKYGIHVVGEGAAKMQ
jgi:hypothetical protein